MIRLNTMQPWKMIKKVTTHSSVKAVPHIVSKRMQVIAHFISPFYFVKNVQ